MSAQEQPYFLAVDDVAKAFGRAAPGYDEAAVLYHRVRDELLERLELVAVTPQCIVDAGVGTGASLTPLRSIYPGAKIVAVDIADGMLAQARAAGARLENIEYLIADCHQLPLPTGSADMVISNLALHCCHDTEQVFREFRRVLRPGGLLSFTTFGPDTLIELRNCWSSVDAATHVHYFYDMHDIGDALQRAGFADPVMDMEPYTLTYASLADLMRDLKAVGEHNISAGRPRGLVGRARFARLEQAYERHRQEQRLPASYEVIYGNAWAGAQRPARRLPDGAVAIGIDQIGRQGSSG